MELLQNESTKNLQGVLVVIVTVFSFVDSRGAIATSYIGLADSEIASFWKGMIAHDHFDGERTWGYPTAIGNPP